TGMHVAGAVDGEALRVGAVLVDEPEIAEVAEDDLAVVVIGMVREFDIHGLGRCGKQADQQGERPCPAAVGVAKHASVSQGNGGTPTKHDRNIGAARGGYN